MKEIPLTKGYVALVDDEDFERFGSMKWHAKADRNHKTVYAQRVIYYGNFRRKHVLLHREITNAPSGCEVDHIDGNGLNCQRSNLRYATHGQNSQNRGMLRNNTSGYKGVDRFKNRWEAKISVNGERIRVGIFASKEAAYEAYQLAAMKYHSEFSNCALAAHPAALQETKP